MLFLSKYPKISPSSIQDGRTGKNAICDALSPNASPYKRTNADLPIPLIPDKIKSFDDFAAT